MTTLLAPLTPDVAAVLDELRAALAAELPDVRVVTCEPADAVLVAESLRGRTERVFVIGEPARPPRLGFASALARAAESVALIEEGLREMCGMTLDAALSDAEMTNPPRPSAPALEPSTIRLDPNDFRAPRTDRAARRDRSGRVGRRDYTARRR